MVERAHRLLERGLGVGSVVVEDVHVLHPHPPQRLVEACEQVLPRTPLAIGPRPHEEARLRRDHEFVAVRGEVQPQDLPEVFLGGARRGAVVVGEIEVGDPEVEGPANDRAAVLEGVHPAEVVPETEREGGEF